MNNTNTMNINVTQDTQNNIQELHNQFNININITNTTNNHNNIKKVKKNEYNINPNSPLRILTQNIQGLNNRCKQQQLLDTLTLNDIDIMGLSETKISNQMSKHILKN